MRNIHAGIVFSVVVWFARRSLAEDTLSVVKTDEERILFFSAIPRLLVLRIYVDGIPWNDYLQQEIGKLYEDFDRDKDGQLSLDEADQVRQPAGGQRLTLARPSAVSTRVHAIGQTSRVSAADDSQGGWSIEPRDAPFPTSR